eukprot:TRINITY_DN5638_c0_g1_i3.p1 TRINITY_DN5638_c0_g1~~TRINITY_DN5638_c0_g1_i3.p1  ORF type:complete len:253 (-),score=62.28 TRINITY_DN5638_c0_g1_i3:83-841(-)
MASSAAHLTAAVGELTAQNISLLPASLTSAISSAASTGEEVAGRGALLVVEGLDRSGKTTQCAELVRSLAAMGHSVLGLRFPDRSSPSGQQISAYLRDSTNCTDDHEIHRLFALNRLEKMDEMQHLLLSGTSLVVDRYSYSGVAFSAAKGLDIQWCKNMEEGLLAADAVLYLDILPEVAARRGGFGEERYETLDFQRKVAEKYNLLKDVSWKVVDASNTTSEVQAAMVATALPVVLRCRSQNLPLRKLWTCQ